LWGRDANGLPAVRAVHSQGSKGVKLLLF
jgi:hypothetical protein